MLDHAVNNSIMVAFHQVFSIDGAFMSAITELPDISMQKSTNFYQKGQRILSFGDKMTSKL